MKRLCIISVMFVLVMAGAAFAGVAGTPHDLTGGSGEICVACHTPHGAVVSTNGPLWNRNQASQSYTVYTSATFDMGPASVSAPQSIACLTCHNGVASTVVNAPGPGTTSPSSYDIAAGAIANWDATPNTFANIGTDLSNDHPIGFTYNTTADVQNNGFPTVTANQIGSTGMYVYAGKMECATCHDVHNQAVPSRSPVYFLRTSNTNSAMCLACHTTK